MTTDPSPRPPTAVVGATGTVGGLVLDELLARGVPVRALVRRPVDTLDRPGVDQVVADLGDPGALRTALDGAASALYVSPHAVDEERYAENFLAAAERTGTRVVFAGVHISRRTLAGRLQGLVFSWMLPSYRGKLRIGRRVEESRTRAVVLAPSNFFQNDEVFLPEIGAGLFPMPMRGVNRVDVRDLAELAAHALVTPRLDPGTYPVAGPATLSGADCAAAWSRALGRDVAYVGDDEVAWRIAFAQRLHGRKHDDWVATGELLGARVVRMDREADATAALLGRPPRTDETYVQEQAAVLAPSAGGPR